MKQLREGAAKHGPDFKAAFADSLLPVRSLLDALFARLSWNGEPFKVSIVFQIDACFPECIILFV